MKSIVLAFLLLSTCLVTVRATVTVENLFGYAYDSSGNLVADNTLWVLVVDADNNNSILGTSLNATLNSLTGNNLFSAGDSINLGTTIGGDTVFAMGGFNGAEGTGTSFSVLNFALGSNGALAGRNYSFVWFPGVVYSGVSPITSGSLAHTIGTQVGAINRSTTDGVSQFNTGMVLPTDGNTIATGAVTTDFGGSATQGQFTAINLIPEPSSFLLTSLALFGFVLRRKR